MTENEAVRWHHRLDGHEFEQAPGVGDILCCFCFMLWFFGHEAPGVEPAPLVLEGRVLTLGPPGKSPHVLHVRQHWIQLSQWYPSLDKWNFEAKSKSC